MVARRDVRKSGGHFFSVSGKGDLAGIAGQPPLPSHVPGQHSWPATAKNEPLAHFLNAMALRPQTPKEKSFGANLLADSLFSSSSTARRRGISTEASVRPVAPLTPLPLTYS